MSQDTSVVSEYDSDHNIPYMQNRHEDFQLFEVEEILRNPDPSKIMTEPPILPKGGEVYLYKPTLDRRVRDQYWWVNRGNNFHSKGQKRPSIMKTYFSLKDRSGLRKSDCLNGFRRHLYRLADAPDDEAHIFIHYLGDETLHKPMPHGNTRFSWFSKLSTTSNDIDMATATEELSMATGFDPPAVRTNAAGQKDLYKQAMARNASNNTGNKHGSSPTNSRTIKQNHFSTKPGSSLTESARQVLDTDTRKKLVKYCRQKTDTNSTVTKQNYLQDSSPSRNFVKVTLTSTQNETQTQPSRTGQPNVQSMSTGQSSVQPTSQAYVHQSLANPVAMKRLKITNPICSIDQRSRPQQTLVSTQQPVKPPINQGTNVIQIQNSLQQSIRTQEQQHQMKLRNLRNSLSNHSQIILSDASQLEQGKQNFIPHSSDYVRQNNQTTTCSTGVSSNSLTAEKCISDDSALPMDYAKFFEEASKLPKMGCDVFVLVSYPGCKPAYWGTEKYVRKFENSERLLPFSESGCLSIKLRGTTDKQNLLANNLDLLSDNPNSLASNMGTEIFIKDEPMESADNMPVAHDDVKQEYPNGGNQTPPTRNRRTRIKVTAQKSDNSLEARNTGSQNTSSFGGKQQYTKQLNTNTHYGGSNTYGFSTKNTNWNGSRQSLRENDGTNYYDTGGSIIKIEPGMDGEHLSMDESTHQLESEIVEPSIVLIKTEPQTADYREVDRLVYTEYG